MYHVYDDMEMCVDVDFMGCVNVVKCMFYVCCITVRKHEYKYGKNYLIMSE